MYLLDILEEHAEEAAFIWVMRQGALRSWNYDLKDLAELEERLFAHLDGLLIGLCERFLRDDQIGQIWWERIRHRIADMRNDASSV